MTTKTITLKAADADGIALSQTLASATDLVLAGALTSVNPRTGVNYFIADVPRVIVIVSAGNDSARTFTISGEDDTGQAASEAVTGANAGTATGTTLFAKINTIAIDGASAAAVTVGTSNAVNSRWIPLDHYLTPFNVGLIINLNSATATYTIQHTLDDVQDSTATITATNHNGLVSQTTSQDGNYAFPVRAMRISVTSFSAGTIDFGYAQAGF